MNTNRFQREIKSFCPAACVHDYYFLVWPASLAASLVWLDRLYSLYVQRYWSTFVFISSPGVPENVLCAVFSFSLVAHITKPFDPCRRGTRHVSIKQDVVFAHVLCMQSYVHVMSVPLVLQDTWSWTRAIRCRMTKLKPNLWLEISIDSFWTWFWPASLAWGFCRH